VPEHLPGGEVNPPPTVGWWQAGERFFATALGQLHGDDFDEPSLLPGWPRRTVVAHVARNADALVNLLTWARTGVETPMYTSAEARDQGISETAALPGPDLTADCAAVAQRLAGAVRALPGQAWNAEVRTAQGRTVPASEVLWVRCREVWVHAIDLDAGADFGDIPEDILTALIDDVVRSWQRRGQHPDVLLASGGRAWGTGSVTLSGDLPRLAGCVTGRHGPEGLSADQPSDLTGSDAARIIARRARSSSSSSLILPSDVGSLMTPRPRCPQPTGHDRRPGTRSACTQCGCGEFPRCPT
jgi:maleylpyruvate isomerase